MKGDATDGSEARRQNLIRANLQGGLVPNKISGVGTNFGLQGGLVPNKISGVCTDLGLLVHVLPGPNKQRETKSSIRLS